MPAKKLTPQQQRDRRAKIMLAVLGGVFLLVMAFEVPSMLGGKKSAASTPPAPVTTASTGVAAPASAPVAPALAVVATPQAGQLTKFNRFAAKNPFKPLAGATASGGTAGSSSSPATTSGGSTPAPPAPKAATPPTTSVPAVTFSSTTTSAPAAPTGPMVLAAVLRLNGQKKVIPVGTLFPEKNPVFKLVAIGKKAMWISLVGGSFGGGTQTLKIMRDHPVKLVNETVSIDYVIRLLKLTMVPKPAAPAVTASAATTPSSTTSTTSTTSTVGS